jgi:hypothetical protein
MCRDMANGVQAYRLQVGKAVREADLVNIFDTGPDVEVSTVTQQREFFSNWYGAKA